MPDEVSTVTSREGRFSVRRARGALVERVGRRRRLPVPGHDHERGHLDYVPGMTEHGLTYLETKPFSAPPTAELAYCLRSFSHVVEYLGLDVRAQVLDGGCGPGWLSEFLARCGYWVTGVDVSPEMIAIAERRYGRIESPIGLGLDPVAEFHALRIGEIPWRRRFDVAVLFDAMHHFDRQLETLRVIRDALVPGGRIVIQESAMATPRVRGRTPLPRRDAGSRHARVTVRAPVPRRGAEDGGLREGHAPGSDRPALRRSPSPPRAEARHRANDVSPDQHGRRERPRGSGPGPGLRGSSRRARCTGSLGLDDRHHDRRGESRPALLARCEGVTRSRSARSR